MTREEAIDILDTLLNDGWLAPSLVPVDEAIRTAVEALKGDMYCPSCGGRLVSESEYAEPNADQHVQRVGSVGDVISRQDALDAISDDIQMYDEELDIDGSDRTIDARRDGLIDALMTVKGLPSVQSWIPCSERLPEKGDNAHYLISISDKALFRDNVYDAFYTGYGWIAGGYHEVVDEHVLAWMPLPKPYGGESE